MRSVLLPIILSLMLFACEREEPQRNLNVSEALGGNAEEGYSQALKPRFFSFPQDHNAHPGFRNEWWYFTGNLHNNEGRRFGYQVTFFRIAVSPEERVGDSSWGSRQVWMGHVALSDINGRQHFAEERWARGAAGLAGTRSSPFTVWLEDWKLSAAVDGAFPWKLDIQTDEFELELTLNPEKPIVLQGEGGLSQKSAETGQASYYYSMTRLQTEGQVSLNGQVTPLSGLSWLDREWSTSALAEDQVGWDWFSLQLNDGRDLMFYQLRKQDGSSDAASSGVLVDKAGVKTALGANQVKLEEKRFWQAADGRKYPVAWRMQVPEQDIDWLVEAALDEQQMQVSVRYWEGAVNVSESKSGDVLGMGYLEMTGY